MPQPPSPSEAQALIAGVLSALTGKHGQVDIRLDRVSLALPGTPIALQLTGTVSVVAHLRDLTDEERKAHVARNVAAIRGK